MGLLPVLDLRKVAVHFTLASSLHCSLYDRRVQLLPVRSSEARLRGLQSARLSLMTAVGACELDAVELLVEDANEVPVHRKRSKTIALPHAALQ